MDLRLILIGACCFLYLRKTLAHWENAFDRGLIKYTKYSYKHTKYVINILNMY